MTRTDASGPVLELSGVGGGFGLNPLAHLNDPLALVNFNPGSLQPPLVHITSLPMNGLLLIITRPPSTAMHCIPCLRSFEHLLVININFSAKKIYKNTSAPPTDGSRRVPS